MRLEGRTAEPITFGVHSGAANGLPRKPSGGLGTESVFEGTDRQEFTRVILAAGAKNLLSVMFVGEWAQICFQQWQELQTCI